MQLTVVGCGDAFGSRGRYNTSFLLEAGGEHVLVDCGATSLVRLKQLQVSIDQIDTIIITHFHGDHYGGVPFLILSRHFEYEHKPLRIIGPPGIKEKLYTLQEALYPGTSEFYEVLGVSFVEYSAGSWQAYDDLAVYAREVTHAPLSNPHGLKLKWKGSVFSYSGDTSWNDCLIDLASGSDLFIIECNNFIDRTTGHLSYEEILEKQSLFDTKKMYLTHMSTEVLDQPELEIERLEDSQVLHF